jgi:hypothetical protein
VASPGLGLGVRVEMQFTGGSAEFRQHIAWADALPQSDPARHEIEGMIYMMLARSAWRRAEQLRESSRARAIRSAAARKARLGKGGDA